MALVNLCILIFSAKTNSSSTPCLSFSSSLSDLKITPILASSWVEAENFVVTLIILGSLGLG